MQRQSAAANGEGVGIREPGCPATSATDDRDVVDRGASAAAGSPCASAMAASASHSCGSCDAAPGALAPHTSSIRPGRVATTDLDRPLRLVCQDRAGVPWAAHDAHKQNSHTDKQVSHTDKEDSHTDKEDSHTDKQNSHT